MIIRSLLRNTLRRGSSALPRTTQALLHSPRFSLSLSVQPHDLCCVRSFSLASSSSSSPPPSHLTPHPSTTPTPHPVPQPALTTPQTLSSLELLSSSHLSQPPTLAPTPTPTTHRRSLAQEAGFRAINDHGLIGNCRTAALVGLDSCITWYCFPHFDSPSVFGAIVDTQRGGHFSIRPVFASPPYHSQSYETDTNILTTTVTNQHRLPQPKSTDRRYKARASTPPKPQEMAITDYLPMDDDDAAEGVGWLVRDLQCTRGPLSADVQCFPAFDYGRAEQRVEVVEGGVRFASKELTMVLTASCPVEWAVSANGKGVFGRIRMAQGDRATLIFRAASPSELSGALPPPPSTAHLLARTRQYWHQWMSQCTYRGRWSPTVRRSALALKLLYFAPEGSCVASPTTSLPETLGGVRNWDYRFAWVRDTSFIIATLLRLGFKAEARKFIGWVQKRAGDMEGGVQGHGLQALYGLRGRRTWRSGSCLTCAATCTRGRCGSATARGTRSSSTSTGDAGDGVAGAYDGCEGDGFGAVEVVAAVHRLDRGASAR